MVVDCTFVGYTFQVESYNCSSCIEAAVGIVGFHIALEVDDFSVENFVSSDTEIGADVDRRNELHVGDFGVGAEAKY